MAKGNYIKFFTPRSFGKTNFLYDNFQARERAAADILSWDYSEIEERLFSMNEDKKLTLRERLVELKERLTQELKETTDAIAYLDANPGLETLDKVKKRLR